jgi:NADPH:quinone reductase-like Zn-dependent oxidoreductase
VDIATAGAIPLVGLTAWQALFDHGEAKAGDTVLILNASGGVGSFGVQFAKAKGLTVIATASAKNTDFVKDLGADAVVDYSSASVTDDVIAAAGGKPVDIVFDCVGGDAVAPGLAALKEGGVVVSVAKFDIGADAEAAGKGQTGKAFMVSPSAEQLTTIAELIDAGKVKMGELTKYPLADIAKAYDLSKTHHVRGKMVLEV